jgi:hypothetical protein
MNAQSAIKITFNSGALRSIFIFPQSISQPGSTLFLTAAEQESFI